MHRSTINKSLFLKREPSFLELSEIVGTLRFVKSQKALDQTAREVIEIARQARLLRHAQMSIEANSLLVSLPASQRLRGIVEYYGVVPRTAPQADFEIIRRTLFRTADSVETLYIPRIILEIGFTHDREGHLSEALRYYAEAAKAATGADGVVAVHAAEYIALLRSDDGDHIGAVTELERLWGIIATASHTYPHLYYSYLNNLAVALNRAGRTEESRRAIARALSSPLANRFPEWRETQNEIEEAVRKEPRRSPATAVVIPAPRERPKKAPARLRIPPNTFIIVVIRLDRVGDITPFRPSKVRALASLLERYVKTVRIRDSP
jgi:tetratricopeptide (TPR) repeat protein